MVDHLHTHIHARTDPDTHTHVSSYFLSKCLDMKKSSIPNVLQRRRRTAAGLPEVVAPFSDTVGLIHTHQGQGHEQGEGLQQHCAVQSLWGHIQHPQPACLHQLHVLCVVPSAWHLSCGTETPECEVSFTHMCCVVPLLIGVRSHTGFGCHGVRCLSAANGGGLRGKLEA